jgi:hypothetical protein
MRRLLAQTLVVAATAFGAVSLAAAPATALDCTWEGTLGDVAVGGVGYVDLDLHALQVSSVCVSTGSHGLYVSYTVADASGPHVDSGVRVCAFTGGTLTSCANPVSHVNVGVSNDDIANTGLAASPGSVWVEVLNGSAPTIRLWVNDTIQYQDLPGRCVTVIGSSGCP